MDELDLLINIVNKERKILKRIIIFRIFSIILTMTGFIILCLKLGWLVVVGLFLIIWGNNIAENLKNK